MHRFRTWLAFCLFVSGSMLVAVTLWFHPAWSCVAKRTYRKILWRQDSAAQEIQFKTVMNVDGITKEGFHFGDAMILTSDCVTIDVREEKLDSSGSAEEKMQRALRGAYHLLEQGPRIDSNGRRVGTRAVVLPASGGRRALILWTDGQRLHSIESCSLGHALELEKQRYQ